MHQTEYEEVSGNFSPSSSPMCCLVSEERLRSVFVNGLEKILKRQRDIRRAKEEEGQGQEEGRKKREKRRGRRRGRRIRKNKRRRKKESFLSSLIPLPFTLFLGY